MRERELAATLETVTAALEDATARVREAAVLQERLGQIVDGWLETSKVQQDRFVALAFINCAEDVIRAVQGKDQL